ncbi:hypothetical protein AB0G67_40225 [Streptomyces sp. NPDC021056]|uniref:hypothetical protein n=1 Tax=Streptomyces sp. NPDC021056 TaxID=3155012 RepID=UPI00340469CC
MDTDPTTPQDIADRSVRPVIEHALTVYFDGNADLARTLIDRLLAEQQDQVGDR